MNDPILVCGPDTIKDSMQQVAMEDLANTVIDHLTSRGIQVDITNEQCLNTGNKVMHDYNFLDGELRMITNYNNSSWLKSYNDIGKPSKDKRLKARAQRKKMKKHHKKNR